MKKSFSEKVVALLLALVICITSVAANQASVSAKSKIRISNTKIMLTVGKSKILKVKGTKKKVKWSSSKKSVATVTSKGKVTAKKAGSTMITAKIGKKKYKCKVTVKKKIVKYEEVTTKKKIIKYGKVTGNVTYYYNAYRGNVADTGANVYLLPENGNSKKISNQIYINWISPTTALKREMNANQAYVTQVDGKGDYHFDRVEEGRYLMIIISKETSDRSWFDDEESYYAILTNIVAPYLSGENAKSFGEGTGYHKYYTESITVYDKDTTNISHDFGITYI